MGLQTGDIIAYDDLCQKFLNDMYAFCASKCVNVGTSMRTDDVLLRISKEPNVRRCFDPRCVSLSNYVAGPVDNGGPTKPKLANNNYWCRKRATGPRPHVLEGSDVGFRNLYLVIDRSEVDLLGKTYNTADMVGSFSRFLSELQPDLKGQIITTRDMVRFYCCLLTFVENKILKVCGGSILKDHTVNPHMVYYFHDGSNDGITVKSVDTITETNFENIGNVMDLLNTRINIHNIKYNVVEVKS